ncbi:MAG: hypothetical protein V1809_02830 [Planctomycetota bacterium]
MSMQHFPPSLAGFAAALAIAAASRGAVVNPKVTSNRTADTYSVESIVQEIVKDRKTAQEKAIALFDFQRRVVYHVNADMYGDHRDFMKSYNVYGHNLCGSQATTAVELARRMRCFEEARVVCVPGHTIYELKYDGKWHTFDTMMNFYVFADKEKTHIANLDEMKENPDLLLKAVEEGRACPGFLHCGDDPKMFTQGRESIADYQFKPTEDLMKYTMLRGESWTRHYLPQFDAPDWCRPLKGGVGPYHGCGGRDDKDPVGFPYWEPYLIPKYGKVSRSYRHWATGFWEYAPDLSNDTAIKDARAKDVAVSGGALRAAGANKPGEFLYNLAHCPWLLVNGKLTAKVTKGAAGDVVKISAGPNPGSLKEVWSAKDAGESTVDVDLFADALPKKAWNCAVKIEIQAADPSTTGVADLRVKLGFLHNYPATPMLLPGENTIKVECDPAGLKDAKLVLTYSWFEVDKDEGQPTYKAEAKKRVQEVTASPTGFAITTPATRKFPKMEFIRLDCR